MPTNVIMPALGLAQDTGKVLKWLKGEGEAVAKGEPLMEIETDKVTVEIEAPASGFLAGVRAAAGDVVPVGQVVGVILAPGESLPATESVPPVSASPALAGSSPAHTGSAPPSPTSIGRLPSSPKARRLAQELGVDITKVVGTGPGGEVTAADVMAAKATGTAAPLSTIWRVMAQRLTQSWTTAPHFYLQRDVASGELARIRRQLHEQRRIDLTYTDMIIAASARVLRDHPRLNARWENGTIVSGQEINIGIAVAVDDGLVVPVLQRVDECSISEIAARRHDLVTRAQAGQLRPDDIRGGTFTITNLGMYGVDAFHPILNPPQAAILGVGRVVDRVVAEGGHPAVRPTMTLVLACDHRVADGARAAQFLDDLANLLEEPSRIQSE